LAVLMDGSCPRVEQGYSKYSLFETMKSQHLSTAARDAHVGTGGVLVVRDAVAV
jgi:hypothetical protein